MDVGICWWMLGRLPVGRTVRVAVTIFFGFGTVFWYAAGLGTLIVAITVPEVPRMARLARSVVLTLKEQLYVRAAVSVGDAHKSAVLGALLRSEGFEVCAADGCPPEHAVLWVTDMAGNPLDAARRYLQKTPQRTLIVYGTPSPECEGLDALYIDESAGLEAIRRAFRQAAARLATA
jgi:hypothetical protein